MNRLDFLILSILNSNDAFGNLSGMTLKEISDSDELNDYKKDTIYRQLLSFKTVGNINYGVKDGHAATYYITDDGKSYLRKEKVK